MSDLQISAHYFNSIFTYSAAWEHSPVPPCVWISFLKRHFNNKWTARFLTALFHCRNFNKTWCNVNQLLCFMLFFFCFHCSSSTLREGFLQLIFAKDLILIQGSQTPNSFRPLKYFVFLVIETRTNSSSLSSLVLLGCSEECCCFRLYSWTTAAFCWQMRHGADALKRN